MSIQEQRLDAKLDRIIDAQAKQSLKLTNALLHLSYVRADLKEHMRRTAAAEARLDEIEKLKYYVIGALFVAGLLSGPLGNFASKLLDLWK